MPHLIDVLLTAVADEDDRVDAAVAPLLPGVAQQAADLRATGEAAYRAHQTGKLAAVRGPAAHLEFIEAAVEREPHVEAAQRIGGHEHLALDPARVIPCRFAARCRIHGEQQPPPPAAAPGGGQAFDLAEEGLSP